MGWWWDGVVGWFGLGCLWGVVTGCGNRVWWWGEVVGDGGVRRWCGLLDSGGDERWWWEMVARKEYHEWYPVKVVRGGGRWW